jgi:putative hemolysin
MKRTWILIALLVVLILAACGGKAKETPGTFESPLPTATTAAGLPNPASKFCEDQGYRLEIRDEAGGQVGYCIFADGTECEEWAFYRGQCAPGTPKP